MTFCVAVTDNHWFNYLKGFNPEDVNFWQPGGNTILKKLLPGAPFLFKLKKPNNAIAGIGFFSSHTILPISKAWELFGWRNGSQNVIELNETIRRLRSKASIEHANPNIGCIVLTDPLFFEEEDWIETPSNWHANTQQYKYYHTEEGIGATLWAKVESRLTKYLKGNVLDGLKSELTISNPDSGYASVLSKVRLGQSAFRVLVTDAYSRRCAITGERTLPVLEAAHIKPYSLSGPHYISNGILLRSDLHKLFDEFYLTVTPDYHVTVSKRIREEFENGKEYYRFHGAQLASIPGLKKNAPATEFLNWHNSQFKS